MSLRDEIGTIARKWDKIPIRAKVNDRWGSFRLSELDDKTVAEWIRDYVLPNFIEEAGS